jgi:soluble lytic murein transglycosylase-like protein
MQFMPETAAGYGLKNPYDPKAAIDAAAHYLRDLLVRFNGRVDLTLAAYNAGEGTVESFQTGRPLRLADGRLINPRGIITGGLPPYLETRNYVSSIMTLFARPSDLITKTVLISRRRIERRGANKTHDLTSDRAKGRATPVRSKAALNSSFIDVQ